MHVCRYLYCSTSEPNTSSVQTNAKCVACQRSVLDVGHIECGKTMPPVLQQASALGAVGRCSMLVHTTILTVGHCGKAVSSVSSTSILQATTVSSAWPQMYVTASGPRVSYRGTDVMEYAVQAASTRTHPAVHTGLGARQIPQLHMTVQHAQRMHAAECMQPSACIRVQSSIRILQFVNISQHLTMRICGQLSHLS